jgi:hypothetical protein
MVGGWDSGDTPPWACGPGASTLPSMPSGRLPTPQRARRPRPSSNAGMTSSLQPGHAVVAHDPGRTDRGDALARCVLSRVRNDPGD